MFHSTPHGHASIAPVWFHHRFIHYSLPTVLMQLWLIVFRIHFAVEYLLQMPNTQLHFNAVFIILHAAVVRHCSRCSTSIFSRNDFFLHYSLFALEFGSFMWCNKKYTVAMLRFFCIISYCKTPQSSRQPMRFLFAVHLMSRGAKVQMRLQFYEMDHWQRK